MQYPKFWRAIHIITTLFLAICKTSMAEPMPIITGSSLAEPLDGAPKDNVKEAPAEQARDKKDSSPEKLNCDSSNSDSGSGTEKDSVR